MAYSLPEFNTPIQYRHYTGGGTWGPWIDAMAQLKGVPKTTTLGPFASILGPAATLLLKLPARTDIRDHPTLTLADEVQIGDWNGGSCYVAQVYDVAYGFPNEYRVAVLARTDNDGSPIARPPGMGEVPTP